ncbi:hypothetical protein Pla52o_02480 [Novipirellula galeiformis]|uniref:Uncharacterized protein n=1 Tax=Novipirellula galeiformis TaxID=2528004 RepID=A0A5C6CR72_9BACT|nr:hypothetical protein [Novipirellula galeiformis]TWU26395.1 hypothetical protein Pla52o_02480 [Novipirellula galeiformis]
MKVATKPLSVSFSNDRDNRQRVPHTLRGSLQTFRNRVWTSKVAESITLVMVAVVVALLFVVVLDRFWDTPMLVRMAIWLLVVGVGFVIPWVLYRWVWQCRRLDQLARLLRRREPGIGGQLLGVLELAESDREQSRSPALCEAAMAQVAELVAQRDLREAVPKTALRVLAGTFAIALVVLAVLTFLATPAVTSACRRLLMPWQSTPRYTFVEIEPLVDSMIVPHGESIRWRVSLKPESRWRPAQAIVRIDGFLQIDAKREADSYTFEFPPRTEATEIKLRVGDLHRTMMLLPKLRPGLTSVTAQMQLPDYLNRPEAIGMDVRGGRLSGVQGSRVDVSATASSPLRNASLDGEAVAVQGASFSTGVFEITKEPRLVRLGWQDEDGLRGRDLFEMAVEGIADAAPSVVAQNLAREQVLLETEQVNFQLQTLDDFGVKRVGLVWDVSEEGASRKVHGEKVLAKGGPYASSLSVAAVFSAAALGIKPGVVELRLWAEDFLPGRERQYSTPYTFYVMTTQQHAQWIAQQMQKWQGASLDVRDRELGLHERNKQLRAMQQGQLSNDAIRNELRKQVVAESANARRLDELTKQGESLLRQAARNTEIEAEQVQDWAEMLKTLGDISENRMPSVAELLKKASEQSTAASVVTDDSEPVGQRRMQSREGKGETAASEAEGSDSEPTKTPSVVDQESSLQPSGPPENDGRAEPAKEMHADDSNSRLDKAVTIVAGPVNESAASEPEPPAADASLEAAVDEQAKLLAEFEKVSDELDAVLANLEGSTLVKRLKAASRQQAQVADEIADHLDVMFGTRDSFSADEHAVLERLAKVEADSALKLAAIISDVEGYYLRRTLMRFKFVLEEMKQLEVVASLAKLSRQIHRDQGLVMAQSEFWADTLDRWADDLIQSGEEEGQSEDENSDPKKLASLPPEAVLEMLRILEGEVNLREATRVAEQSKSSLSEAEYRQDAIRLSDRQTELRQRSERLASDLEALPDGQVHFEGDINLMLMASQTMNEAASMLRSPNTAREAIAAQTEVIEMLLRSKRINPQGGGEGGASPEGGGQGDTEEEALALLGAGLNAKEKLRESESLQMTGQSGRSLPEEFRAGLGEYFRRLEESR